MNIFKLKYNTREEGILDLISKGVILEDTIFEIPTHAVVDIGEGRFDIMTELEYDFGINQVYPLEPEHSFAGYDNIILNLNIFKDNE